MAVASGDDGRAPRPPVGGFGPKGWGGQILGENPLGPLGGLTTGHDEAMKGPIRQRFFGGALAQVELEGEDACREGGHDAGPFGLLA